MIEGRLIGADFVRAAACLMVLIHHLVQRLSYGALPPGARPAYLFALEGAFGVAVFFVLSGFLLARPFWLVFDAAGPMPSLRAYTLHRAARIIPAFWVALTATFILSVTLFEVPFDASLVGRYLAGVFFLSDWHWSTLFPVEFNGPLWSIGFEVTSYVLLPLCLALLFIARRGPWASRLIWLGVIAAIVGIHWLVVRYLPMDHSRTGWQYGLQGGAKVWVPRFNPFGFFAIFAVGALAAGLQVRTARLKSAAFDAVALLGLALAVWSMATTAGAREIEGFAFASLPYGYPVFAVGVGLILAALPSSLLLGRLAENPVAAFLARISYGIYVWHFLIIETIRQLWVPDFRVGGMGQIGPWLLTSAIVVAASVAFGTASFYVVEQPIIRWARSFERSRAAPTTAAIAPSSPRRS